MPFVPLGKIRAADRVGSGKAGAVAKKRLRGLGSKIRDRVCQRYLVDLIANVLEQDNIHEYCVDAGGDILHKNTQTIRVGLEDPENLGQVVGVCELGNGSICGSAGNRRKWENFNHIMNPITRASSEGILAVWVTAETAMLADALATCLFFVPASALYEHKFEYVLIHADRSVERSAHFAGELFSV